MARPDVKNGHARIANELINVFCKINLQSYEWRILWAIIRMSWSWGQKGCYSSYRELASKTGIDLRHTARAVQSLIDKFIVITRAGRKKTYFELNTDYETWRIPEKESLFTVASPGNTRGNGVLPYQATQGVASLGNAESPEMIDIQQIRDFLKKF
jgi:phage replication O-like protein O